MKPTTLDDQICVVTSRTAEELLRENLHGLDHEEVWVLYLTARNTVIGREMLSKGTLNQTSLDCRTVLRQALLHNAMSIILLHNHPSGDPRPSQQDIRFTDKLHGACRMLDIKLIDHIIVGGEHFYSFSDERTYKIC